MGTLGPVRGSPTVNKVPARADHISGARLDPDHGSEEFERSRPCWSGRRHRQHFSCGPSRAGLVAKSSEENRRSGSWDADETLVDAGRQGLKPRRVESNSQWTKRFPRCGRFCPRHLTVLLSLSAFVCFGLRAFSGFPRFIHGLAAIFADLPEFYDHRHVSQPRRIIVERRS